MAVRRTAAVAAPAPLLAEVKPSSRGVLRRRLFPNARTEAVVFATNGPRPLDTRTPVQDPDHEHYLFTGQHLLKERKRTHDWEIANVGSLCDVGMVSFSQTLTSQSRCADQAVRAWRIQATVHQDTLLLAVCCIKLIPHFVDGRQVARIFRL